MTSCIKRLICLIRNIEFRFARAYGTEAWSETRVYYDREDEVILMLWKYDYDFEDGPKSEEVTDEGDKQLPNLMKGIIIFFTML